MKKSELRQLIKEVLREELASKKHLKESSVQNKSERLKRSILILLTERGFAGMARLVNQFDFVITDTIRPGTVEITGNTINIHSDLLNGQLNNIIIEVIQAIQAIKASKTAGSDATISKYVIASKHNPTKVEKAFYLFDDNNFYFELVNLLSATSYTSLGEARFTANNILSMSDLHRIYILDANTLVEVDSLDYYNDYEDEKDYPGYFDAP